MSGVRKMEALWKMFIESVEKQLGRKLIGAELDTTRSIFIIAYQLGYNQRDYESKVKET